MLNFRSLNEAHPRLQMPRAWIMYNDALCAWKLYCDYVLYRRMTKLVWMQATPLQTYHVDSPGRMLLIQTAGVSSTSLVFLVMFSIRTTPYKDGSSMLSVGLVTGFIRYVRESYWRKIRFEYSDMHSNEYRRLVASRKAVHGIPRSP